MVTATGIKDVANSAVTLDARGYFSKSGRTIVPVGVNYWPGSCGVEMWQAWPEQEMQHDLDVMRNLGLNCVRFFLRWPDFEPELGRYEEGMFDRLRKYMGWCAQRGMLIHPSLVIGGMSGGNFWPRGKDHRNLFADPLMVERSAAYCGKAAGVLAPFRENMIALDLGNELGIRDAWEAPPAAIRHWCQTVTDAIRAACPHTLIVNGLDSGQVSVDYGWRLGEQPGTDFYSAHTYPVPGWNVVPFDGMTDPVCQAILPFNVLASRAFGPVMVQEFGTILTNGKPECESYLKAVLPACMKNGANGFLWWCFRDVSAQVHPYIKGGFEGRLGLVDAQDRVKPSLEWAMDYFRSLNTQPLPERPAAQIALYWPREYYKRDNERNPGNDPSNQFRRMIAAYHLLTQMGHNVGIARGDLPFDPALKTLLITGAALTSVESRDLEAWVRRGGRVLWSGPTWSQWTTSCDALIGAQPVDIRMPKGITVTLFGEKWSLNNHPSDGRVAARVTTAKVLAISDDGLPTLLSNALGDGKVVTVLATVEDTIAHTVDRAARDRWRQWYDGLLTELAAK